MRRSAEGIRNTAGRVEDTKRALASPGQRSRQVAGQAVHSTGTKDVGVGRKSSRLAEVNQAPKPARRRWMRPSSLPVVPTIPGYRCRYTRIDERNRGDRRNLEKRLREGWELVRRDELPKHSLPALTLDRYGEVIGTDDMVLMKLHEDLVEERNAEYQQATRRQTKGVQDTLREMGYKTGAKPKIRVDEKVDIPRRARGQVRDDEPEDD